MVEVGHKLVVQFDNAYNIGGASNHCYNTQAAVVVSHKAYVLKCSNIRNTENNCEAILYVLDLSTNPPTAQNPIQINNNGRYYLFQHPNDITHHNAMFYLANFQHLSTQSDIIAFDRTGSIQGRYNFHDDFPYDELAGDTPSSITYYKNNKYIIGVKKTGTYRKYYVVHFDSDNKICLDFSFKADGCNLSGFEGNSIYYDNTNEYFYVILCNKNNSKNRIYTYDLSNVTDDDLLTSVRILNDEPDSSSTDLLFEYEGMYIYNNKKYVVVNRKVQAIDNGTDYDGVYHVYAKSGEGEL